MKTVLGLVALHSRHMTMTAAQTTDLTNSIKFNNLSPKAEREAVAREQIFTGEGERKP